MASKENPALGEAGLPNHSALAAEPSEDKLARQEPQAAIERYGNWLVIGRDATRKRLTCRCVVCSHICTIGASALESGEVIFCGGCVAPRNNPAPASQGRSFSKQVAEEATKGARKRHFGGAAR